MPEIWISVKRLRWDNGSGQNITGKERGEIKGTKNNERKTKAFSNALFFLNGTNTLHIYAQTQLVYWSCKRIIHKDHGC